MAAIDLTPAEVTTEAQRTATVSVPKPAPPLDGVSITLSRREGALWASVYWGEESVTFPTNVAIPVADRAAFRTALGRLLVHARDVLGAT
jgi:hypothetical protein